jgi:hypothetical protein
MASYKKRFQPENEIEQCYKKAEEGDSVLSDSENSSQSESESEDCRRKCNRKF